MGRITTFVFQLFKYFAKEISTFDSVPQSSSVRTLCRDVKAALPCMSECQRAAALKPCRALYLVSESGRQTHSGAPFAPSCTCDLDL